jgi:hypothetical protein
MSTESEQYEAAKLLKPCTQPNCIKRYQKMLDIIASRSSHNQKNFKIDHCDNQGCHELFYPGYGISCYSSGCKTKWCSKCTFNREGTTTKTTKEYGIDNQEYDDIQILSFYCNKCIHN